MNETNHLYLPHSEQNEYYVLSEHGHWQLVPVHALTKGRVFRVARSPHVTSDKLLQYNRRAELISCTQVGTTKDALPKRLALEEIWKEAMEKQAQAATARFSPTAERPIDKPAQWTKPILTEDYLPGAFYAKPHKFMRLNLATGKWDENPENLRTGDIIREDDERIQVVTDVKKGGSFLETQELADFKEVDNVRHGRTITTISDEVADVNLDDVEDILEWSKGQTSDPVLLRNLEAAQAAAKRAPVDKLKEAFRDLAANMYAQGTNHATALSLEAAKKMIQSEPSLKIWVNEVDKFLDRYLPQEETKR